MATDILNTQIRELRELKRMEDELNQQIEAIQDSIKAYMSDAGTDEIHGIDWKVTWKKVVSVRLDGTALKKAMPEVYDSYSKISEYRRFLLV